MAAKKKVAKKPAKKAKKPAKKSQETGQKRQKIVLLFKLLSGFKRI